MPPKKATAKLDKVTILIVEDDKILSRLIYDVLVKLGFRSIVVASNGREAIHALQLRRMDLIICDWRMPGMSGIEFTKYVRLSPQSPSHFVPILMLTGNAEAHHVTEARDAGITEYLIKPFAIKELCARITEIVERPRDFVFCESFSGPCRRRKEVELPTGYDRRKRRPNKLKQEEA